MTTFAYYIFYLDKLFSLIDTLRFAQNAKELECALYLSINTTLWPEEKQTHFTVNAQDNFLGIKHVMLLIYATFGRQEY